MPATNPDNDPIDLSKIKIEFPDAGKYSEEDPNFKEELRLLRKELAIPGAIKAACVHEVGHLTYFRLLGKALSILPNEFWIVGPAVTYTLNAKYQYEFDHRVAATRTPFNKDNLDYTDDTLLMLANACFAGGVFSHELANGALKGDKEDRKRFHLYYDSAIKQKGQPELLESELEAGAIRAVTYDLQNVTARRQVLIDANQIGAKYFF